MRFNAWMWSTIIVPFPLNWVRPLGGGHGELRAGEDQQ